MKFPFSLSKKEKKEYFLAILLRDEKVTAVIFGQSQGLVNTIGQHEAYFTESIETASADEWLDVLDKAISTAEGVLPKDVETQKTIFGVKENWVEEGIKLKKEYLVLLKKACDALDLVPIGFLVISEAVAHLMQEQEGAPVSAVLVELGQKTLTISLLRAGHIVETKRTKIEEDSIAKITDRLLHHFTSYEVLPSRVVIVGDTEKNEELSQEFITHSWSKSLPFLHVPQVTIKTKDFEAKAVLSGAATQMGFELLRKEGKADETIENKKEIPEIEELSELEEKEIVTQDFENADFGFVKDHDVAVNYATSKSAEKDIEGNEKKEETNEQKKSYSDKTVVAGSSFLDIAKTTVLSLFSLGKNIFGKIVDITPPLPSSFPIKGKRNTAIITIVLFIFLGLIFFYIFLIKATITITLEPKTVEKNQDIIFSTNSPSDIEQKTIAVNSLSVNEEGTISKPATGKKEVGEKAKGTITIFSTLQKEQSFNKGMTVTSTNDLTFVLDEKVLVASSSGASDPKTAKVAVVAQDIGKESNLPSGTKFTVASFSSSEVEAKNDTAFSGGTKKDVTVVSKSDQDKALADLSKNLAEKAKEDLEKNLEDGIGIIDTIVKSSFVKKEFDKKVNDEAGQVKLSGIISYTTFSYQKSDLEDFSQKLLKEENSNLIIAKEDTSYTFDNVKQKNEKQALATLHIKAALLPKIESEKIIKDFSGKSFADAKNILLDLPQVSNVQITLSPSLFFFPKVLPRMSQNIDVKIIRQ